MSEWETFCDESYYHLWRVRRKSDRNFNDGVHVQDGKEAADLVELLNRLERERDEARDNTPWHSNGETKDEWFARQREKYAVLERERDEAWKFLREATKQRDDALAELEVRVKERDEARELARNLYWAGWELRRFARAYANDYDEADGKRGAEEADYAFYEASINLAKVLGEV